MCNSTMELKDVITLVIASMSFILAVVSDNNLNIF
jgi:hypothetical protein